MQDFIVSLVMFFLVEPLQADLNEKLAATNIPPAIVQEVTRCATNAAPTVAERVMSEPWWGVTTLVGVWIGMSDPIEAVSDAAPMCGQILKGAQQISS